MQIRTPTVGPIVGHVGTKVARVWLRGDETIPITPNPEYLTAALRLRPVGAGRWGKVRFVKLEAHFDFTGVFVVNRLKPGQRYEYEAGWFAAESEMDELDAGMELDWSGAFAGEFTTAPEAVDAPRHYVVGSCRYLLMMAGGTVFDRRGDKTFRTIRRQLEAGEPVDGLIMIGDQIYADDLNALRPDEKIDQFLERYRTVFAQEHHRHLMARVPTYMMLDDHEIEDNWPEHADPRDRLTLYPHAMHAYQIYQASLSPLIPADRRGRLTGRPAHWWYTFTDGCCDWFMLDCRTERQLTDDPAARRMISPTQMAALKKWLAKKTGRAKVIASSVPLFPDFKEANDDKWSGFARQRAELLEFIFAKRIRKVLFLGGDVHCSLAAALTHPNDPAFRVLSVISSAFFWPYPQFWPFDALNESSFQLKGALTGTDANPFEVSKVSKTIYKDDNFARLRINTNGVQTRFITRKGDELDSVAWEF